MSTAPARADTVGARNVRAVCLSQFLLVLSFNFANVFLPFYIRDISRLSPEQTVLWTGWIMGAPTAVLVFCAPFWTRLTGRMSPKLLYQRGLLVDVVTLALMPLATDLRHLLALQIVSGIFGGVSMIGLVLITASSPPEELSSNIGLFQASLTAGQVLGPLVGSYTATAFGFRWSFLLASAGAACTMIYAQLAITDRRIPPRSTAGGPIVLPWVAAAVALMVTVTMQLVFLPSLLPYLLGRMGVTGPEAVRAAGLIVLAYSATAAGGALLIGRLAGRIGFLRAVVGCAALCSALLWSLARVDNVVAFGVLRAAQTAVVAGIFPMVVGRAARTAGPGTLGVLASSRFAGNAGGVLLGTSLYGRWGTEAVFHTLAALTLLTAAAFAAVHLRLSARHPTPGPRPRPAER